MVQIKELHGNAGKLYLICASVNNRPAWYYIKANTIKAPLLDHAITNGYKTDLASFGVILCSGWGDMPPPMVQKEFE